MKKIKTQHMTKVALVSAFLAILGPLTIPLGPVPLSLANLGIFLSIYLLGRSLATLSTGLYLLLGLVGLPIFSGFSGGVSKLIGPTGGYLLGYLLITIISGYFVDREKGSGQELLGLALGQGSCYLIGSSWLAFQAKLSFGAALSLGVLPFIPGDLLKIALVLKIGPLIRSKIKKLGLFS